jgi:HK97 family phage major capsid protein
MQDKNKLEKIARNWEAFKEQNDLKLKQIASQKTPDPITLEQINKINQKLDYSNSFAAARPHSSLQDYQISVKPEDNYQKAFCNYVRKGAEGDISDLNSCNGFSSLGQEDTGYSITSRMNYFINNSLKTNSIMRSLANLMQISSDSIDLLDLDKNGIVAGWTEKVIMDSDAQAPIKVSKKTVKTHQLYAMPKATQKLVDDPYIDIELWLSEALAEVFALQENQAFIKGDGINQPRGILKAMNQENTIKVNNPLSLHNTDPIKKQKALTDEDIMRLFYSLPSSFVREAKFLVGREAMQQIRMLKEESTGRYLWQPDFSKEMSSTLLGHEIFIANDLPNMNQKESSIIFADFKKSYQIVDRHDIRILRDPFTQKPFIKFYGTKTVGGEIMNSDAIRFLATAL